MLNWNLGERAINPSWLQLVRREPNLTQLWKAPILSARSYTYNGTIFLLYVVARPQHVRGHQDDRIGPLTFLESLNVRMDLFAKSIAQTHIHNGWPALNTYSTVGYGTITMRGIMVCTYLQRTLYQSIHHQDMVYFLANNLSIDEQRVHTDLAWHSFRKARK